MSIHNIFVKQFSLLDAGSLTVVEIPGAVSNKTAGCSISMSLSATATAVNFDVELAFNSDNDAPGVPRAWVRLPENTGKTADFFLSILAPLKAVRLRVNAVPTGDIIFVVRSEG